MRALYVEGVALHDGPASCADRRAAAGEALTGVHAGRVLRRESKSSGVPTRFFEQGKWLRSVVRGYFAHHGLTTNVRRRASFRTPRLRS
jgi:hypothetical protein